MHGPVQLFTVIALVSLPTVMYGGYALMGLLKRGALDDRQKGFFRAGHAHAGVLLVLALVALQVLDRSGLSDPLRWVVCFLLLFGVLAQSGGFFVAMLRTRVGMSITTAGAVLLGAAMLTTAYGVAFL
ncbi:hypothetical protein VSH64_42060 [Amycolatopsis rhabdoformis]|uniref:Integral membrane protein n=1 Tax=Amycolatopsis rhabdoformis TaxID=1448059 RepID=A0ABZ1I4H3_9PSEU|nr:hypothetical protein [Amycolatopsis rhabdoformis]WSE29324.1 hypothetical protein VSH64_42060 [Amycolatopsis rhabdoformis]